MTRLPTISACTLLVFSACESPLELFNHVQVQTAITELVVMNGGESLPPGCAVDPAGNTPPNLEATWTTTECQFTYGQLGLMVGAECAMQLTLDYQSGDRIEQVNEGQVSSGTGETFITGPIPEIDGDNATLWVYNHAKGDYGCELDSAVIQFMHESPGDPNAWQFCALAVVLWQNGHSTCPGEDWWVSQGTLRR